MVYQLQGIHDGFGIRNELIFISIFSAPCFILYFLIPAVSPEFTVKYVDRTTYMALILVASHIPSIIMPLFRHFKNTPSNCPITSRAFRRKTRRVVSKSTTSIEPGMSNGNHGGARDGKNKSNPSGSGSGWTPTTTVVTGGEEDLSHSSQIQFPSVPAQTVPKHAVSGREQPETISSTITIQDDLPKGSEQQHHHTLSTHYQQRHGRKHSTGNMNLSLRSLLKNPKLSQFHRAGFGQQQQQDLADLDSHKADWDAFSRVLFERLSAFTV
jgi:hypothetical protein